MNLIGERSFWSGKDFRGFCVLDQIQVLGGEERREGKLFTYSSAPSCFTVYGSSERRTWMKTFVIPKNGYGSLECYKENKFQFLTRLGMRPKCRHRRQTV